MIKENINPSNTPVYSIGSASRLLNLSVHTLRMYERENLIIPYKSKNSHRLYSESDIERLRCIQDAIKNWKLSIPAIKMIYSMIPCWSIIKCSEQDRKNCSAYNSHSSPCWSFKHKNNICEKLNCRNCIVYNEFTTCEKIKSGIINITESK